MLAGGDRLLQWSIDGNTGNAFIIERRTTANSLWTEIGRSDVGGVSFVDASSLSAAAYLLYRIRSIDPAGRISLPTDEMSLPPPLAPLIFLWRRTGMGR